MKVFMIGASGLVGSHCLRVFSENDHEVLGTHNSFPVDRTIFFDCTDPSCFDRLNEEGFKPDLIIHCGALTNVDYCEDNEEESHNMTVQSTANIAEYCQRNQVKLVYISTDYVFDGIDGPYDESVVPNPINIYGKHKLAAETIVSALSDFLIVRITNVYGEELRNKNFVAALITAFQKNTPKEFKLPYDQFATPVYSGDIARGLLALVENEKTGIYNLSSTDYYNRYQLARKVENVLGASSTNVQITAYKTLQLAQRARRPLNGGLLNNKFSNDFPLFQFTNIDQFITEKYKDGI